MTIISCPACGKQVSPKAKACPGCGYPVAYPDFYSLVDTSELSIADLVCIYTDKIPSDDSALEVENPFGRMEKYGYDLEYDATKAQVRAIIDLIDIRYNQVVPDCPEQRQLVAFRKYCDLVRGFAKARQAGKLTESEKADTVGRLESALGWCDSAKDRGFIERAIEHCKELRTNRTEDTKEASSSCFVATVCCGRSDHPTVVTLRSFRDRWLRPSWLGRVLINWYEKVGPTIAVSISRRPLQRRFLAKVLSAIAAVLRRGVGEAKDGDVK